MDQFQLAFAGKNTHIPFWFMRQAGRYLPEYRAIREASNGFLDMCYSPEKAVEVTLQPLRRFPLSAAIIFSDILVIPHALGLELAFEAGEGPKLQVIHEKQQVPSYQEQTFKQHLEPVYVALQQMRAAMPQDKTLIGFTGAVWTLMCYMLQGRGGKEFAVAREAIYSKKDVIEALKEVLIQSISEHLIAQVHAGATAVQIFDSWAGLAPHTHIDALIIQPTREIVKRFKLVHPNIAVIGFPRGLGNHLKAYAENTGVDGIGIDCFTSLEEAKRQVPEHVVIQGNLDPLMLASSKEDTLAYAQQSVNTMQGRKFIFNLGHGIVPHTPVEHVQALSDYLARTEV